MTTIGGETNPHAKVTISAGLLRLLLLANLVTVGISVAAILSLVKSALSFPAQVAMVFVLGTLLLFPSQLVRSDSMNERPRVLRWLAGIVVIGALIFIAARFIPGA